MVNISSVVKLFDVDTRIYLFNYLTDHSKCACILYFILSTCSNMIRCYIVIVRQSDGTFNGAPCQE